MSELTRRRRFLSLSGKALLAGMMPPLAGLNALAYGKEAGKLAATSPTARELYRKAFVFDANCLPGIGGLCCHQYTAEGMGILRESGITALKSTLGGYDGSFESTVSDIADTQRLFDTYPEAFIKVTRHDDLARAKAEGKLALVLSFEAASMLGDKVDRIDLFRKLDVLVMQLSYNHKSPFGCGCLDGDTDGLTPLGRQAIARMNQLGVALDLSHANVATTAQAIEASTRPPVFTHTGCRGVYAHPRNKEDREMRALADKGGVMGIYMLPYLTEDTRQPVLDDYMRHLTHALDVCGEEHVGIGTDSLFATVTDEDIKDALKNFRERAAKGVAAPGENRPPYLPDINTPRKLEYVADALLRRGYGASTVDKILGLNFSRVFKDIWLA